MRVVDMMSSEGRVFFKSEWGQIGDEWPCVSFTRPSVGDKLRRDFRPGRDILIYVGTSGHETEPEHRSALISATVPQPNQVLETRKIVPPAEWEKSLSRFGDRWPFALAVTRAADLEGPPYPSAYAVAPQAYASLGGSNRGTIAEVVRSERDAVMRLPIKEFQLRLAPEVQAYVGLAKSTSPSVPLSVKQEATRMAELIIGRVLASGEPVTGRAPLRTAPALAELFPMLVSKWSEQGGRCRLCQGPMSLLATNPLLQGSADRINSGDPSYKPENVQITHLACNWAKNKYDFTAFQEWLGVIRDTGAQS